MCYLLADREVWVRLRLALLQIAEHHIEPSDNDRWLVLNRCVAIASEHTQASASRLAKKRNAADTVLPPADIPQWLKWGVC